MRIEFEDHIFDSETRQLSRAGDVLHISPKAFHLLKVLLSNRPRALSKKKLQETLWPDTFVDESNLATLAAEIRGILDDDARHPKFLRTAYGFGYAFCGEARNLSDLSEPDRSRAGAAFRLFLGEREIRLSEGEHILGRDAETHVWIDSVSASRRHARITVSPQDAILEDLGSKNGTILNGKRIDRPTRLQDGDRIHIALVTMVFRAISATGSTATASSL